MKYLLDTNVISEIIAKRPNMDVLNWLESIPDADMGLSVISIGEICAGIERLPESPRKENLRLWLEFDLLPRFSTRILELSFPVMRLWGNLTARQALAGKTMDTLDSLIAATALEAHCIVVTRNERDFIHASVKVLNPWKK